VICLNYTFAILDLQQKIKKEQKINKKQKYPKPKLWVFKVFKVII
jgi:hypothetical protein